MGESSFKKEWGGWCPDALRELELTEALKTTHSERLQWLCSMLTIFEKQAIAELERRYQESIRLQRLQGS